MMEKTIAKSDFEVTRMFFREKCRWKKMGRIELKGNQGWCSSITEVEEGKKK
jgi:hypothetical protein